MNLANISLPPDAAIDKAVTVISLGRIFPYGAPSWIAPTLSARILGAGAAARDPHVRYLMRIFGIRAIALGASYLLNDGESKRRSQRLAVVVDTADTVMAPFCGLPRRVVLRSLAITVPYAAVGWLRLLKDLQKRDCPALDALRQFAHRKPPVLHRTHASTANQRQRRCV